MKRDGHGVVAERALAFGNGDFEPLPGRSKVQAQRRRAGLLQRGGRPHQEKQCGAAARGQVQPAQCRRRRPGDPAQEYCLVIVPEDLFGRPQGIAG